MKAVFHTGWLVLLASFCINAGRASADAIYPTSYTTQGISLGFANGSDGPGFGFIDSAGSASIALSNQIKSGSWPGAPSPGTWPDAPDWTKAATISPVYDYGYYLNILHEDAPYVGWLNYNAELTFQFLGTTAINSIALVADSNTSAAVYLPTAVQLQVVDSFGNAIGSATQFSSLSWTAGPSTSGGNPSYSLDLNTSGLAVGSSDALQVTLTQDRRGAWTLFNDVGFTGSQISAAPLPAADWAGLALIVVLAGGRCVQRHKYRVTIDSRIG